MLYAAEPPRTELSWGYRASGIKKKIQGELEYVLVMPGWDRVVDAVARADRPMDRHYIV